jgi:hypothetical protein
MGSIDEKNQRSKIPCKYTFKIILEERRHVVLVEGYQRNMQGLLLDIIDRRVVSDDSHDTIPTKIILFNILWEDRFAV